MKLIRTIHTNILRFLRPISLTEYAKDLNVMETAKTVVASYYHILPVMSYIYLTLTISEKPNFEPILPLSWVTYFSLEFSTALLIVKMFFIFVALLSVFFYKKRWMRLLVFIAILQAHALTSSFGSINHQWYTWLYTSLIFVFLPDIWTVAKAQFETNRKFLLQIWFAQAAFMLTYTMAGLHKFIISYKQHVAGEIHGLSMQAFSYQTAEWTLLLQEQALLVPFIINYPLFGWPFYVGLHFLQLFSLWIMIRTSLQKIWVLLLMAFHIGVVLSMGISFLPHVILLGILFFNTPFTKPTVTPKEFFFDLPVIGQFAEILLVKMKKKHS